MLCSRKHARPLLRERVGACQNCSGVRCNSNINKTSATNTDGCVGPAKSTLLLRVVRLWFNFFLISGTTCCDAAWMVPDAEWMVGEVYEGSSSSFQRTSSSPAESSVWSIAAPWFSGATSEFGCWREWSAGAGHWTAPRRHAFESPAGGYDECSGRRRPDVSRIARQFEAGSSSGPASPSGGQDQGNHQFHRTSEYQANILRLEEQLAEAKSQEEQARQHLHDGEERLCKLRQEASRMAEDIPPTAPVDFEAELAQLRSSVHELQRERCTTPFQCTLRRARTEATSKSVIQHSGVGSVESRGSRAERDSRSGSTRGRWRFFCSDGDFDRQRRVEFPQCEQVQSIADNMIRSAGYGLRGVRVGEAKHPGPPRVNTSTDQPETGVVEALEFDLTQADSSDAGEHR